MSDFLDYGVIKRKIESEVCSEHNEYSKFIKTAKGFQINSCCESFKMKLTEKVKKIITKQTEIAVQKMFKKVFKK
ncbi:hypothetical protein CFS9_37910 [Flavobacterium sp. CFS9]|uniref:Uncharacterized protein n=1 Tax=Flavobacterium sp. CFS9 TaxID=3143118 RepID=A0AAT9H629_9FLAO